MAMSPLAEQYLPDRRVTRETRSGHAWRPNRGASFTQPVEQLRFRCGFDNKCVTFREYLEHIRSCKSQECRDRKENHEDLRQSLGLMRDF